MNFSLCRPVKILLLGAGGTGGYVAPHLYRLMHTLNRPVRINIVDGDLVEAQNLVRQNFCAADLGENKAKVLATRYEEPISPDGGFSDRAQARHHLPAVP